MRRRLGRQLVEAGERLGVAVDVELLEARQEAIASEDPEQEELPLEGAAAGAVGAEERPPHEERIGLQAEDVVCRRAASSASSSQARMSWSAPSAPRADQVPKIRWSTTSMAGANAAA